MASIDWKKLTFTGKEVIGAVVFLLTMSGSWYNTQFKITACENAVIEVKGRLEKSTTKAEELEKRVQELEADKKLRDALQEYSAGYTPMKKVKQ